MSAVSPLALALVAVGGALGSMARYLASVLAVEWLGTGFPWGTLAVNVIGSALIGVAAGGGIEGGARLLVITGFLGGFTTFSAFSLETGLLYGRHPILAALYVTATLAAGLMAFSLGWWVMRR